MDLRPCGWILVKEQEETWKKENIFRKVSNKNKIKEGYRIKIVFLLTKETFCVFCLW